MTRASRGPSNERESSDRTYVPRTSASQKSHRERRAVFWVKVIGLLFRAMVEVIRVSVRIFTISIRVI